MNELEESVKYLEEALERTKKEMESDSSYYSCLQITITYNLARNYESLWQHDRAETLYKDILKEHPNYIDCKLISFILLYNRFFKTFLQLTINSMEIVDIYIIFY